MDDVVTKDCIVVARRTDSPVAMASQNTSKTTGSVVDNTARDGKKQSKTSSIRSLRSARSRAQPSSSSTTRKQAVKKTPVATGSAPTKGPQPSSGAAAAAKQLGLTASMGTESIATGSSRLLATADIRPLKRHYSDAFPPSQQKQNKPEYPRRGAPPEYINQPRFEVESIHSEDEEEDEDADASDSDEPLVESHKRRIASRTPNDSAADIAAAQIQSLTQQLSEARTAFSKAAQEKKNAAELAIQLQKQLGEKDKRCTSLEATIKDLQQKGEATKQAVAARITELEKENTLVSEMNVNAKIRYGKLQGRNTLLKNEFDQAVLDLNSARTRCVELRNSNIQLQAEVSRLEHRDRRWQDAWDERMAREEKWRSDLIGVINELNAPRGNGGARR